MFEDIPEYCFWKLLWTNLLLGSISMNLKRGSEKVIRHPNDPYCVIDVMGPGQIGYPKWFSDLGDEVVIYARNGVITIDKKMLRGLGFLDIRMKKRGKFIHAELL